jgi:quercetin dioxygenase-like cupin family protein
MQHVGSPEENVSPGGKKPNAVRQRTPDRQIDADEKSAEVRLIEAGIQAEGNSRKTPKKGTPLWVSEIALLRVLFDFAVSHPGVKYRESKNDGARPIKSFRQVATALRRRLERYYSSGPGAGHAIRITMPQQKYLLLFERNSAASGQTTANAAEFARLLVAACRERGLTRQEVERDFWTKWVGGPWRNSDFYKQAAAFSSAVNPKKQTTFIDSLNSRRIGLADMHSIGGLFNIHPLVFDPLLSIPLRQDAIQVRLDDGFFVPPEPKDVGANFDRKRARYSIPKQRLAQAQTAIVQLQLEKGAESDTHTHPGDELVLVIEGKVEFCLNDCGLSVVLEPGDYAHFYAEQTHSAVALEASRLFIIRSYQTEGPDSRQAMRREIDSCLESSKPLSALNKAWIRFLSSPGAHLGPAWVRDKIGLARLLRRIREYSSRHPTNDSRAWESGDMDVSAADLEEIATEYRVKPFLLHPYLFPSAPNVVVVKTSIDGSPLMMYPLSSMNPDDPKKHQFYAPRCNLACSDLSISEHVLAPGTSGFINEHPGLELLIPLSGAGTLYYQAGKDELETCRVSKDGEIYGHYSAEKPHFLRNTGTEDAKFLILRFHNDGQSARPSAPGRKGGIRSSKSDAARSAS